MMAIYIQSIYVLNDSNTSITLVQSNWVQAQYDDWQIIKTLLYDQSGKINELIYLSQFQGKTSLQGRYMW